VINRLEVVTLSLLRARPRTGYDVAKWLEQAGPYVGYSARPSQVYRQMRSMEDAGWTTSAREERDAAPDARVHSITAAGVAELEAWIDSPYQPVPRPLDPDFQVRLRFSAVRGPEKLLELVRIELDYRRRAEVTTRATESDGIDAGVADLLPADAPDAQRAWMREAGLLQQDRGHLMTANLIAWLEIAELRLSTRVARDDD
jgi:DNA-binding PadR family transcriptional regulator